MIISQAILKEKNECEIIEMTIFDFNPWWKTLSVPKHYKGKTRDILKTLISYLDYRQIILIFGLRRAGKTTIMYQLIDYLLEKHNAFQIMYFSFDEQQFDPEELLNIYQTEILKKSLQTDQTIFLFFDEIQKLKDWANKIKLIYDRYPNIKIIVSGSSNLLLQSSIKESLAGRFFEFSIDPLNFDEYIRFKGISIDKEREALYESEIKIQIQSYLKTGGFIEAITFDEVVMKKYFKESLLERVIYKDIPETFKINSPHLLFKLLNIITSNPGLYLDYKLIGNDLKIDQRTISNYFNYLENSLLLKKLYNYSKNQLTSEKKLKRMYVNNTAFIYALSSDNTSLDVILENYFVCMFTANFFYRSPQKKEVDIILNKKLPIPVEIKFRNKIRHQDLKNTIAFMNKFKVNKGIIISKDHDEIINIDNLRLYILPYWKYWSILSITGASGE